jgi:hypothetical protein
MNFLQNPKCKVPGKCFPFYFVSSNARMKRHKAALLSGDPRRVKNALCMREWHQRRIEPYAQILREIKAKGCTDCKSTEHPMEFDHRDPSQKIERVAQFRFWTSRGMDAFLEEVAKCDCVCIACHRKRTASRITTLSQTQWAIRNRKYAAVSRQLEIDRIVAEGCAICNMTGTLENKELFDFDHIDPTTKRAHVSRLRNSTNRHREELAKCRVLCKKCHKEHTSLEHAKIVETVANDPAFARKYRKRLGDENM